MAATRGKSDAGTSRGKGTTKKEVLRFNRTRAETFFFLRICCNISWSFVSSRSKESGCCLPFFLTHAGVWDRPKACTFFWMQIFFYYVIYLFTPRFDQTIIEYKWKKRRFSFFFPLFPIDWNVFLYGIFSLFSSSIISLFFSFLNVFGLSWWRTPPDTTRHVTDAYDLPQLFRPPSTNTVPSPAHLHSLPEIRHPR